MRSRVTVIKNLFLLGVALLLAGCVKYRPRPLSAPAVEHQYRSRSIVDDGLAKSALAAGWNRWPPAVLDLNALTLIAAYYNPDLDVSRTQVAIAQAGVQTATARLNPSLTGDGGYNTNPDTHPLYGGALGFTIETAGKRGYRILQAERDAEAASLLFSEAQWQLWSRVRTALVDVALAQERLSLLERETNLRFEISQMLDKRLSVGAASQPEAGLYRVELLRSQAALEAIRGDALAKRVALATAVGVAPQSLNRAVAFPGLEQPPVDIDFPIHNVQRAGLLHRIDIRRAVVEYAAAEAALRLEIARQYPDLQLTPGYNFEEGFARYTFSSLIGSLPVFDRNQGPIRAAEARRAQGEARLRALQSQAIGEMERALALYRSAFQEWREESDRLDRIEREREQAAQRALDVGQGDRFSLTLIQLERNTAALGRLDALVQVQASLGALENSVQQPLEAGMTIPLVPVVNPRREITH